MFAIYTQLEVIQDGQHFIVWKIFSLYKTWRSAHWDRLHLYSDENFRLGFALGEEIEIYFAFGGSNVNN